MDTILVAEDDREINRLICEYLDTQGYSTVSAENGLDALRMAGDDGISLVLLDLMLPYKSGDMVLSKLRETSDVPVIVVSAKSETRSKIDLIAMGADDYITKPFDLDELAVRIAAVLRRYGSRAQTPGKLSFKGLVLDTSSCTASVNGTDLPLTVKEYAILSLMLSNPKKLFSKANIYESIWNEPYYDDDRTVKVHMSNIRTKLSKLDPDNEYIETVWGMGYRLMN
ncbi:MAG: response regulator transcription factor [Oscillospiraceae bacterium]|nr:response regulator transcription factor [Oscillospiraceae bacterium]